VHSIKETSSSVANLKQIDINFLDEYQLSFDDRMFLDNYEAFPRVVIEWIVTP
jgi:hypothetical protein